MATVPYFILGPTAILSLIGLFKGRNKKVTEEPEPGWRDKVVDVIIPSYNEQRHVTLSIASLANQTIKPRRIVLIDDHSDDKTVQYAKGFAKTLGMKLDVIKRRKHMGKTPAIYYGAHLEEADVEFVLDADTVLESANYIERLVEELYRGEGIASASGLIRPFRMRDYYAMLVKYPKLKKFHDANPESNYPDKLSFFKRISRKIAHLYREVLYSFLQRFVYHSEMLWFGTIVNPIGCAVAYRREYICEVIDKYTACMGLDLTTSEDVFIGFAFTMQGYRNIQLDDVHMRTQEPSLCQLPKQIFLWSSAFLQSCYYFPELLTTPLKSIRLLFSSHKNRVSTSFKKDGDEVKATYFLPLGEEYTKRYGRPVGWYIFSLMFEKISFPIVLLIMIIFRWWEPLLITVIFETLLISVIYSFGSHVGNRMGNFVESILITPVRYLTLAYDLFVISVFVLDLLRRRQGRWRK